VLTTRAPGKVNLCLLVGAPRPDGLHPLVSVVQPVDLADTLTLEPGEDADVVICPGVEGENLALRALGEFRAATGWDAPPQRLTIDKRLPVAAGMAGGSSDAAAALRELTADEAAGAKLWATELQFRVMDRCLQLHGGYGYMDEYEISRLWRDARVTRIYGGTSEIMKDIVGRALHLYD